jgi:hypothetical protein
MRKHISDMFFQAELEDEMRRPTCEDRLDWTFFMDGDREKYLEMVLSESSQQRYHHTPVSGCKERGKFFSL